MITKRGRPKKETTAIISPDEILEVEADEDVIEQIDENVKVDIPTEVTVPEVVEKQKRVKIRLPPCDHCDSRRSMPRSVAMKKLKNRYGEVWECPECLRIYVRGAGGYRRCD